MPLFFEPSELIIDGTHRVGNVFFAFFVRYLRILAGKLVVLS